MYVTDVNAGTSVSKSFESFESVPVSFGTASFLNVRPPSSANAHRAWQSANARSVSGSTATRTGSLDLFASVSSLTTAAPTRADPKSRFDILDLSSSSILGATPTPVSRTRVAEKPLISNGANVS